MQPTSDITAATTSQPQSLPRSASRLGEELPIFCERCGYSLVGLPQLRCGLCNILHFHCPECGHHQPINTLRPAAQRIIGRIRAFVLGFWVFFKLNFFGWTLFGWFVAGHENSYDYNYRHGGLDQWVIIGFLIWGGLWGFLSRMLVLRWHKDLLVALVLAGLVVGAMTLGARSFRGSNWVATDNVLPLSAIASLLAVAGFAVAAGAALAWPAWVLAVRILLPVRAGRALLDWQRSHGQRRIPAGDATLARE